MKCSIPNCKTFGRRRIPRAALEYAQSSFPTARLHKESRVCADHQLSFKALSEKGIRFAMIERNSNTIKTYTGLKNGAVFKSLLKFLRSQHNPTSITYAITGNNSCSLSYEDQLLLTLKKLRLGSTDATLASDFQISRTLAASLWKTWLDIMVKKFRAAAGEEIPSLGVCQKALPTCFSFHPNTRLIIDCTELPIEAPSDITQKAKWYSSYKSQYTAKFLLGVAPCGVLVFASRCYPGSTSDKEIVQHCGILEKLSVGDNLMADKGFLIHDLLPEGVTLNVPAGMWGKTQFTSEEVAGNRKTASARIHVERFIGYMKNFGVLAKRVPNQLLPYLSDILFVCCQLTNLLPVIIRELDDQFKSLI